MPGFDVVIKGQAAEDGITPKEIVVRSLALYKKFQPLLKAGEKVYTSTPDDKTETPIIIDWYETPTAA
jgi:hypothetical protein